MKRTLRFTIAPILNIFIFSLLFGCSTPTEKLEKKISEKNEVKTLIPQESPKSCLWKASTDKGVCYIQGSMHLLKASDYPLAPAIEQAYAQSDIIVFETDINKMQSVETQQLLLQKAMIMPPNSLEKMLSPDVYALFKAECEKAGLPTIGFNQMKPWMASMMLSMTKIMKMGFSPTQGLDMYFSKKAKQDGKKVEGLEAIEFQINLMGELSDIDPNEFIKKTIEDIQIIETEMGKLKDAWTKGDIETLGNILNQSLEGYPTMKTKFIDNRNTNWIKKIKDYPNTGKTHMIIIGAGHLPGEKGVLKLLQKEGFKLEQL